MGELETAHAGLEARARQREQDLTASHARLRDVEMRRVLAVEQQKQLKNMHDGIGWALMHTLSEVERGNWRGLHVAQVLRESIDEMKLTIDSLEPMEGDLLLLLATLRYRLEPRFEQAGIAFDWAYGEIPPLPWLETQSALRILRIFHRAFAIILKEARATWVGVAVEAGSESVSITMEDNGAHDPAQDTHRELAWEQIIAPHAEHPVSAHVSQIRLPGLTRFELRLPLREG